MTMVDIPSRSRSSPISSTASRSYYGETESSGSPTRSRSPHRLADSPSILHSKYDDREIPVVEPSTFMVKQEDEDQRVDVVRLQKIVVTKVLLDVFYEECHKIRRKTQ